MRSAILQHAYEPRENTTSRQTHSIHTLQTPLTLPIEPWSFWMEPIKNFVVEMVRKVMNSAQYEGRIPSHFQIHPLDRVLQTACHQDGLGRRWTLRRRARLQTVPIIAL